MIDHIESIGLIPLFIAFPFLIWIQTDPQMHLSKSSQMSMNPKSMDQRKERKKHQWILYKLSQCDDSKMWHQLHKSNNRLRHLDTTLPSSQCMYSSAFRNTGHRLNLTSTHRSEIGQYDIVGVTNKSWHRSGVPFSKLSRWKSAPNLFAKTTVAETLGLDDPLQDRFVSNHTKHDHDHRVQQKLEALNVQHQKQDHLSAAFAAPERPELFELDKFVKEHPFDRIDTESLIFTQNSQYWLRDNIGFSIKQSLKDSMLHSKQSKSKHALKHQKTLKSKHLRNVHSRSTTRLPRILQESTTYSTNANVHVTLKGNGSNSNSKYNQMSPSKATNHHINGHTVSAPGCARRRVVGSKSLNKLYKELEFKSLSDILSSKKVGVASRYGIGSLTASSVSPHGSTARTSNGGNGSTSESTAMHSPLLNIKLLPRTPINHKQVKKYLYKNIFDKSRPNNKIYVLGSNSIQGMPPVTPLTS